MAERFQTEIDGLTVAYQRAGSGPMVVMLHGIGGAASQFRAQLEGLADEFTVIAWDAPGYGDSDDPDGDWRMPDYAQRLAGLLAQLSLEPVHLLGQSWGGLLAQEFYRQYPERVRSLILSDTFAGSAVRPEEQRNAILQGRLDALATKTPAEMAAARLPMLITEDASDAVRQEIETMLAAIHPDGYRQAAIALHHTDFRDLLAKISVPTLVIAGEHDQIVAMEHSRQLAEGIPGARLEVISGSGHLSNQQKPDEYNAIVRQFLREVGGDQ